MKKIYLLTCILIILSACLEDEGQNNSNPQKENKTFVYEQTEIVTNSHTRVDTSADPFGGDAVYDDIAFTMDVVASDPSGRFLDDLDFDPVCYGIPGQFILVKVKNISDLKYANLMIENISLRLNDESEISLQDRPYAMSSLGGWSDDPKNVILPDGSGYILIELPTDVPGDAVIDKVSALTFDIGPNTNNANFISVDEDDGLYVMKMEAELDTDNILRYINFQMGSYGATGHLLEKITCIITDSQDRPLAHYVLDSFKESIYAEVNYHSFINDWQEFRMDFTGMNVSIPCRAYNVHFFIKNYLFDK